jgi:hypothetical protein
MLDSNIFMGQSVPVPFGDRDLKVIGVRETPYLVIMDSDEKIILCLAMTAAHGYTVHRGEETFDGMKLAI